MRKRITSWWPSVLFLPLLLVGFRATAGDTLRVSSPFYHIDRINNILLINQRVADINAGDHRWTHLQLDGVYALNQPIDSARTDIGFRATSNLGVYRLYFTQLPVVEIGTRLPILDTPSVHGRFSLVEASGQQVRSDLGIEFRGGFSQWFAKKSFELSFWADTLGTASRDVGLLGMRTDNKYNLQAMYNEPLRFNGKVSNELWMDLHQPYYRTAEPEAKSGVTMQYVELLLNGQYQGVYALSERIDRKQLKLKKYSNGITGELYKGSDWGGAVTFDTLPPFNNASTTWGGFEYKHPEEQVDWSRLYDFVAFVENSTDNSFYAGIRQKFHAGNAVDYYLFLNLLRAGDNTGKNLYIARYKQGEPYFYVPWDLDGTFGTDYAGNNTGDVDDILTNGLYTRLNQDCAADGFREALRTRWTALRATILTEAAIMARFRANYEYLATNNVYEREGLAWGNPQADPNQLTYMTNWLRHRLSYLDGVFGQTCSSVTAAAGAKPAVALALYPNPASGAVNVQCDAAAYELIIRDLSGRPVLQKALKGPQNQVSTQGLGKGLYVVTIRSAQGVATQKLVLQ